MSERLSSFFILSGVILVVLILWYLSVRFVWWDTRRRSIKPLEHKAWVGAAIVLPLFGFALYLFTQMLRGYLVPPPDKVFGADVLSGNHNPEPEPGKDRKYSALQIDNRQAEEMYIDVKEYAPFPEPAWAKTAPPHSNGKTHAFQTPETTRTPYPYQPTHTRYSLLVAQGPLEGQQFVLKLLPARIGRGTEVEVSLDADLNISRKHAEIYEWNGTLRIRDLESMHGTKINGIAVKDQALVPGDRITLGSTELILRELP